MSAGSKSRFARGTPEYAEELRLEILAFVVGMVLGFALAINVHIKPRKVWPASGFDQPCDAAMCLV